MFRSTRKVLIRIHVTNAVVFIAPLRKHEQRQVATSMINLWRQEFGSDVVHVTLDDWTGQEVGGTTFTGGVWVADE